MSKKPKRLVQGKEQYETLKYLARASESYIKSFLIV